MSFRFTTSVRYLHIKITAAVVAVFWTLLIGVSLAWNIRQINSSIHELALAEAKGAYNKDLAYRRWASSYGGVYVPASDLYPPNSFLTELEDRDIISPSGKLLTLLNPAYMTRQVHEMSEGQYGIKGHITSLNPIRPDNDPDPWERRVLNLFEEGESEYSEIVSFNGEDYIRFMNVMIIEESCLTCHAQQGYALGDIRGGISVSVPMGPYRAIANRNIRSLWMGHLLFWVLGLIGLTFGTTRLVRRIREKEETEFELSLSQRNLEEAQSITHLGSWELNLERNVLTWSDEIYRIFGLQPQEFGATYEAFLDTIHPDDRDIVDKAYTDSVENNIPYDIVHRIVRPNGEVRYVREMSEEIKDASGKTIRSVGTVHDITDQIQMEEQLRQSQKMEAMGRLAGGVAHDFNNLLTVIQGNLDLALLTIDDDHPLREKLETVAKASSSATTLTRQLLAFSKKEITERQLVDLNEILFQLERMLRRVIGEDLEFSLKLEENIGPVFADPGQIEQVLMNLVVNARDAMPDGGVLAISTNMVHLESDYTHLRPDLEEGSYVILSVSDTGCGMDTETKAKIFEPFFTTKSEGTGLGLATVYGIVNQHDGSIHVYSEEGLGTTFKVYLPVSSEDVEPSVSEVKSGAVPSGHESILLIEDDRSVLQLASDVLQGLGYSVESFIHPEEAIKFCKANDNEIDLIVTDVVMPGMNGNELANHIHEVMPEIPVLYMSGYAGDIFGKINDLSKKGNFLSKPFTPRQLGQKVREILDNQ